MTAQVLMVGAGVMGCIGAMRLLQAGVSVTLLERALPGAESSSAAAGILGAQSEVSGPGPFQELCLASRALYPDLVGELLELTGIHVDYSRAGVLEVALDAGEGRIVAGRAQWMLERGLTVELLDSEEAIRLEPALSPRIVGANYYPEDHHLDPARLAAALAAAVARLGGIFRSGEKVAGVVREGERVTGVRTESGLIGADAVVVAGGAWSTGMEGLPPLRTRVKPMAGQIVRVTTRPPLLHHVLYGLKGYLVPRPDGQVVMGSTLEERGFDKAVTPDGLHRITGMARELAPDLGAARLVDAWAGLRPATGDNLPLLGGCASLRGLYFATGHYRNGILLAPITGEVIRDLVLGRPLSMEIAPFLP